jgi:hypothetical protein
MKFYIMMLMVVWVAAVVSAMVSGGMMMRKRAMHRMKGMWRDKMGQMQEKACEEMEREKEPM